MVLAFRKSSRSHRFQSTSVPVLRSEEHTSELQSRSDLVCRLLLEKKKKAAVNQRVDQDELRIIVQGMGGHARLLPNAFGEAPRPTVAGRASLWAVMETRDDTWGWM